MLSASVTQRQIWESKRRGVHHIKTTGKKHHKFDCFVTFDRAAPDSAYDTAPAGHAALLETVNNVAARSERLLRMPCPLSNIRRLPSDKALPYTESFLRFSQLLVDHYERDHAAPPEELLRSLPHDGLNSGVAPADVLAASRAALAAGLVSPQGDDLLYVITSDRVPSDGLDAQPYGHRDLFQEFSQILYVGVTRTDPASGFYFRPLQHLNTASTRMTLVQWQFDQLMARRIRQNGPGSASNGPGSASNVNGAASNVAFNVYIRILYAGPHARRLEQLFVPALNSHVLTGGSNGQAGGNTASDAKEVPDFLVKLLKDQLERERQKPVTDGESRPENVFLMIRVKDIVEHILGRPLCFVGLLGPSNQPRALNPRNHNLLVLSYWRLYKWANIQPGDADNLLVGDAVCWTRANSAKPFDNVWRRNLPAAVGRIVEVIPDDPSPEPPMSPIRRYLAPLAPRLASRPA